MIYLNLNDSNLHKLIKVTDELTRDTKLFVGNSVIGFDNDAFFSEGSKATSLFTKLNDTLEGSFIHSDNFSIKVTTDEEKIRYGLGCINVKVAESADIMVDGINFYIHYPSTEGKEGYVDVNLVDIPQTVAYNLAYQISMFCPHVTATNHGRYVLINNRTAETGLVGIENESIVINVSALPVSDETIGFYLTANGSTYDFEGNSSYDDEPVIEGTTIKFKLYSTLTETADSISRAINKLEVLGYSNVYNNKAMLYCCSETTAGTNYGAYFYFVKKDGNPTSNLVYTTSSSSYATENVTNVLALDEYSVLPQIASVVRVAYPSDIDTQYLENDNKLTCVWNENYPDIFIYTNALYLESTPVLPAHPYYNVVAEYIHTELSELGITSYLRDDSVKVELASTVPVSVTPDNALGIYGVGTEEFPSTLEDYASNIDVEYLMSRSSNIDALTIIEGSDNGNTLSFINRSVTLSIGTKDSYVALSKSLMFVSCYVDIIIDCARIIVDNEERLYGVFNFENCQGFVTISNSEVWCKKGAFLNFNRCSNIQITNKSNSYLVTNGFDNNIVMFNSTVASIASRYNAIDLQADGSGYVGYFYNKVASDVIFGETQDCAYLEGRLFYCNDTTVLPKKVSERKLLCGLNNGKITAWSFNLTCNSEALKFAYDNISTDILKHSRGLRNALGRLDVYLKDDNVQVSKSSCIIINDTNYYLHEYQIQYSFGDWSTDKLLSVIVEMLSYTTDYKVSYDYDTVSENYVLHFYGSIPIVEFDEELSEKLVVDGGISQFIEGTTLVTDYATTQYTKCVDAGARQKHTNYDITYYVDTTIDSTIPSDVMREGTQDNPFSCQDMVDMIRSSYPRFGDTKFILYGNSSVAQSLIYTDLSIATCSGISEEDSRNFSKWYGDIVISSTMRGIREVPVFRITKLSEEDESIALIVGCYGAANMIFDNIMLVGTEQILKCIEEMPSFKLSINNCVVKTTSDTDVIIESNDSALTIVESTLINYSNDIVKYGSTFKFEANIYGKGNLVQQGDTTYNHPLINYNYQISETESTEGTNISGPQVLDAKSLSVLDINNVKLSDFFINEALSNNKALNMIPNVYALLVENSNKMYDIGGRLRYSDTTKTSIDVGAVESEQGLVDPNVIVYNVSLENAEGMNADTEEHFISWEDLCNIFEDKDTINEIYKINVYGYGNIKNPLHIKSTSAFYEQASIQIHGNNCVFEGTSLVDSECKYANIVIKGVIARCTEDVIKVSRGSTVTVLNSFIALNSPEVSHNMFNVTEECTLNLVTSSLVASGSNRFIERNGYIVNVWDIGCLAQGDGPSDFGVLEGATNTTENGKMICNNISDWDNESDAVLDVNVLTDDTITGGLIKPLINPDNSFGLFKADMSEEDSNADRLFLIKNCIKYGWNKDINGRVRALSFNPVVGTDGNSSVELLRANNQLTTPGCYDLNAKTSNDFYKDIPNREETIITEIGRTVITKMLSNSIRFKIEGYAIASDGYVYDNPVLSDVVKEDVKRESIIYRISDSAISAPSTFKIKYNERVIAYSEFSGSTKQEIRDNLVNVINKIAPDANLYNDAGFVAYKVAASDILVVEKILPGDSISEFKFYIDNTEVEDNEYIVKESIINPVYDVNYSNNQILPRFGFRTFEKIDYLPLAISMFYTIKREEWDGGYGSEVVFARITESTDFEYPADTVFPLCVCHHGLITKSNDNFVSGCIILQI